MANASDLKKKALQLSAKGKNEEAVDKYLKYLDVSKAKGIEEGSILNNIGDLYFKLNKKNDGFSTYQKAIEVYRTEQLYNNAVAIIKKALRKCKGDISKEKILHRLLVDVYFEQNLNYEAEMHLIQLIKLLSSNGELEEALSELDRLMGLIDSFKEFNVYLNVLDLYKNLNEIDKAIEKFSPILQRYIDLKDDQKIEALKNKLKELNPDFEKQFNVTTEITQEPKVNEITESDNTAADDFFLDDSAADDIFAESDEAAATSPNGSNAGVNFATGEATNIFDISEFGQTEKNQGKKNDEETSESSVKEYGVVDFDLKDEDSAEDEKISTVEDTTFFDIDESVGFLQDSMIGKEISGEKDKSISGTTDVIKEDVNEEDIEILEKMLIENPTDGKTNYNLAKSYYSKKMFEEAYQHFEVANDSFLEEEKYDLCWEVLLKMIEIHPAQLKNYELLMDVARVDNNMKRISAASFQMAKYHNYKKEFDKAEMLLERVLRFDPENKEANKMLSSIKGETQIEEKDEESIDIFADDESEVTASEEDSLFIEDDEKETLEVKSKKEDLTKGGKAFDFGKNKDNVRRIETKTDSSDVKDLINEFEEGVGKVIEKEDYDSHYDLGVAYKDMGFYEEAIKEFKQATKGKTQKLKAYEMWGMCLLELNRAEDALNVLVKGAKTKGFKPNQYLGIYYRIGRIYENHKRNQQALKLYSKIYKIDKEFKDDNFVSISKKLKEMQQKVMNEIQADLQKEESLQHGTAIVKEEIPDEPPDPVIPEEPKEIKKDVQEEPKKEDVKESTITLDDIRKSKSDAVTDKEEEKKKKEEEEKRKKRNRISFI